MENIIFQSVITTRVLKEFGQEDFINRMIKKAKSILIEKGVREEDIKAVYKNNILYLTN